MEPEEERLDRIDCDILDAEAEDARWTPEMTVKQQSAVRWANAYWCDMEAEFEQDSIEFMNSQERMLD